MTTVTAASAPADFVGTGIVLIGACDPLLFQPKSLVEKGLISETDASQLRYDILSQDITVLRLPWVQIVAETTKITATTTLEAPLGEPIRDFLLAYCDALPIRRFTAVGLNHDTHFGVPDEESWHKVGHTLAPKAFWAPLVGNPGMLSIAIKGSPEDGREHGAVNIRVEPSLRIKPGVYVQVNDHIGSDEKTLSEDPDFILTAIEEQWDKSKARSDKIVSALKELANVPS